MDEKKQVTGIYDTVAGLTSKEIKECRKQVRGMVIAPFDEAKAKGIGYNLSPTELMYSITSHKMLTVHRSAEETYVYIKPFETVLTLSYEYIKIASDLAGTFHSKVRTTALGIGSTSTTLDPSWKGMLLFAINNPTRKKIKLVISTHKNGVDITNSIITIVVGRVPENKQGEEIEKLHLDNPAMRMDIWSEFISKPYHLLHNKNYQKFKELLQNLLDFKADITPEIENSMRIQELLLKLELGLFANNSSKEVREALLVTRKIQDIPAEMQRKLEKLTEALREEQYLKNSDKLMEYCRTDEYREKLELAERECEYQVLNSQIMQMHEYIHKHVPYTWKHSFTSNIVHKVLLPNIAGILSSVILVLTVIYGMKMGEQGNAIKILLAMIPGIMSMIIEAVRRIL